MNESLACTLPQGMLNPAGEGIRLLGLPAEKSAKKELSGSADEVVKNITSLINQMVSAAIEKRTAQEFEQAKEALFPQYAKLSLHLAGIVAAVIPSSTLSRLASESFSELEADIREHAVAAFGQNMRDRAMFTVWTLRKTSDLLAELGTADLAKEDVNRQAGFLGSFLVYALSARFGIDCLRMSIKTGRAIYPDVFPALDNTLRGAVDAYAWIKQAVDLRHGANDEQPMAEQPWDEEDDLLLRESMLDLSRE